jgi:hypothetical protein
METFAKMAELDHEQQTSTIRSALVSMGTNCDVNDDDPMGNGDQSRIATDAQREAARELFAMGGDMEIYFREQKLSPFCFLCVTGQGDTVRKMLEEETSGLEQPWSQSQTFKALLDTRVTSLRMSPLLLMVSLGKNLVLPGEPSPLKSFYWSMEPRQMCRMCVERLFDTMVPVLWRTKCRLIFQICALKLPRQSICMAKRWN